LHVTVTTKGFEVDTDGYAVHVDGKNVGRTPAVGEAFLTGIPTGQFTFSLDDVSPGCRMIGTQVQYTEIVPDDTTEVELDLECGDFIAQWSNSAGVFTSLFRFDGTREGLVMPTPGSTLNDAAFSRDGRKIAFRGSGYVEGSGLTFGLMVSTLGERTLSVVVPSVYAVEPDFSRDGEWLAYRDVCSDLGTCDRWHIAVVRLDGTNRRFVFGPSEAAEHDPTWSADGSALYFPRWTGLRWILARGDVATGQITAVDSACAYYKGLDLSPDGSTLATGCQLSGPSGTLAAIRLVDLLSGATSEVASGPGLIYSVAWSARGRSLLFDRETGAGRHLYRVGRDGADLTPLRSDTIAFDPVPLRR
jgi:hypothetical protein